MIEPRNLCIAGAVAEAPRARPGRWSSLPLHQQAAPPGARALWFDGSGWCLLSKRLEAGSFQLRLLDDTARKVEVDGTTFASLLAGIDFTAAQEGGFRRRHADRTGRIDSGTPV